MKIEHLEQQRFYKDFLPLIAELECGRHYDAANDQHVEWLQRRISALYAGGGTAICSYSDEGEPLGFLLLVFDQGLEGVRCFGKKATIAMFGLFAKHRSKGMGASLLREAETYTKRNGGECVYVDTYANNSRAIQYYVKQGFIPVAYHPGENGLDDKGQVYLYKELTEPEAQPDAPLDGDSAAASSPPVS